MDKSHLKTLILTMCIGFISFTGFSQKAQISLNVFGIKEAVGQICFAVYQSEEDYKESENQFMAECIPVDSINFQYVIKDVPFGTYVISLFHDEDENEELNTNWIGMPREPFGFSNDAKGRMGPPKFEDASFIVEDDRIVEINLMEL
jgi:uncharacterized protein (DUF2141 family)